ncbi:MAG TPA: energy transducer TonB [Rhizomicrobium sp.]|jgi:TonB family protein
MKKIIPALLATLLASTGASADETKPLPPNMTAPSPANEHTVKVEDYPVISRAQHEQGSVILRITITEDGRATDPQVAQSSGFPRLDQAAIEVVARDWLYHPATRDGKPIKVTTEVRVRFIQPTQDPTLSLQPDMPFTIFKMTPKDYPPTALAQKEQGLVLLMVVVNEQGEIVMARPTHPGNFPDLDQASIAIVKSWRIKPAEMNGKPIKTVLSPIFVWSLETAPDGTAAAAPPKPTP